MKFSIFILEHSKYNCYEFYVRYLQFCILFGYVSIVFVGSIHVELTFLYICCLIMF